MEDTEATALALLDAAPALYRGLFSGLPESIVTANLDRDWSPKRILAHMIDVEPIFAQRLHRMIDEERPSFTSADPLATLESGDLMSRPVAALLADLTSQRGNTVAWLQCLSPEQLQRTAVLDTIGEFTVRQLLHYWPSHDMAHLRGIQRMLIAVLGHEMGPTQQFDI